MEAKDHNHSSFVTLTYEDDPDHLIKKDLQLWQKRFRKELAKTSQKCRFYSIGEYGTKKGRPHFHSIIFGPHPLISEAISQTTWQHGFTKTTPMLPTHAAYVARYSTKKLGRSTNQGRDTPEFAIMSRKPALGSRFLDNIISTLTRASQTGKLTNINIMERCTVLRQGGKIYPLPYTFRKKIISSLIPHSEQDAWMKCNRMLEDSQIRRDWKLPFSRKQSDREASTAKATSIQKNYKEYL